MKHIDKIAIAIPPVKSGRSFVGAALPPMGVTRMATFLQAKYPEIPIELFDGVLIGQNELERKVQKLSSSSVLGISAHTSLNYINCLRLANKSPTSNLVIGGIHVDGKRCGRLAVEKRGFDVIQGQGEFSFAQYIEYLQGKRNKSEVDGLIYLENGRIVENQIRTFPQTVLPFPNYEHFLPMEDYGKIYRRFFQNGDLGLTIISPEGCKWQGMVGRNKRYCVFCDIGTNFALHDARFLGRWIQDSVNRYGKYGKVFLVDYADEATGAGIQWWREALDGIPGDLTPNQDYGIKIYAKSGKGFFDSEELARVLQKIGVEDIHVGFEAATDEDLRSLHKGSLMQHHYQLVDLAAKYNFRVVAAFVLGAPTATQSSLEKCVKFSEMVRDKLEDKLTVVTGSPLMPLPGAPAWDMLRKKAYERREDVNLFETDNPDLHQARELWYGWFCDKLSKECGGADKAIEYAKQIGSKLNKMGSLPTPENEFG